MKPQCKFCGAHHYEGEAHPAEAVKAALEELRRTAPPASEFAVGARTVADVREHVESVTKPERYETPAPVTKPPTEEQVLRNSKGGRPRAHGTNAERQRAYRERQSKE